MRYIDKDLDNEPKSLAQYKQTQVPTPNYEDYKDKQDIREALLHEQHYICCYCMCRISAETMRIEHFKPQVPYDGTNGYDNFTLDYSNMLGACDGGEGGDKNLYHCDKSKQNYEIIINPRDSNMMDSLRFQGSGLIEVDKQYPENKELQAEIDTVLRLNQGFLCRTRKGIIDGLRQIVQKRFPNKPVTKSFINDKIKSLEKPDADNKLPEYVQVAVYWLQKQLSKAM